MAVTPNSLLQATAQASAKSKTQAAPVSPLASIAEPGDGKAWRLGLRLVLGFLGVELREAGSLVP
ncbi:hypothetical protein, partial [Pseudomonas protegens]|uniref:hypothetical protein n=1 Tax=Pseudomonas protegens TaxID=380021 RepID=UPI001B32B2D0